MFWFKAKNEHKSSCEMDNKMTLCWALEVEKGRSEYSSMGQLSQL